MYISVRTYEDVSDMEAVVEAGKEGLTPIIQQCPGFISYYFIVSDPKTGCSISCFDTKGNAVAAYSRIRGWVTENLRPYISQPPGIAGGINRQERLAPQSVKDGDLVAIMRVKMAVPASQEVSERAAPILAELMGDPETKGYFAFVDEAATDTMCGLLVATTDFDIMRLCKLLSERMQEQLSDIYPATPEIEIGEVAVAIQAQ